MTLQHIIGEHFLDGATDTDRKVIVENGPNGTYTITEQLRHLKNHAPTEWEFLNRAQYTEHYHTQDSAYESYDVELCIKDVKLVPWSQEINSQGDKVHGTTQYIQEYVVNEYGINGPEHTLLDSHIIPFSDYIV